MPTRLKPLATSLLLGMSCLIWSNSMATESTTTAGPPQTYRLDEVSVRLTRQPGRPNFPLQRISLTGKGSATLERGGQSQPFHYTAQDLLGVLNELYRIHFFDLPNNYSTRHSVSLKDDGMVITGHLRLQDASSTIVCFAVAAYEKCVTYTTEGPYELEKLTQRVFAQAEQLAGKTLPQK
jgi:hypothetical protein